MAVREILQLGNPYLREQSAAVADVHAAEIRRAIADLSDTLIDFQRENGFGRAISAVQIGIPTRIIFMQIDKPVILINPVVTNFSAEKMVLWDDCFSFRDLMVKVERALRVDVQYLNEAGYKCSIKAEGPLSELLQHEIDHLDGILAIDRAMDNDSLCLRPEWEKRYRTTSLFEKSQKSSV